MTDAVLFVFLIMFLWNTYDLFKKLYVRTDDAVSGKFEYFGNYENMLDLDSKPQGA